MTPAGRRRLVVGNWKMNLGEREARSLVAAIAAAFDFDRTDGAVAPASITSGMESSPVKAPLGSQCTFCAPTVTSSRPEAASHPALILTEGGKNQSRLPGTGEVTWRKRVRKSRVADGP